MSRFYRLGAVASAAMFVVLMAPASLSAGADTPQWTVMVYMDGDNNLEDMAILNMQWMEDVGSDPGFVNFVVLMDTYGEDANLLYVTKGGSTPVVSADGDRYGYPKEVNMADPATLQSFIEISYANYEAQNYALILWDHGGGWRGLCWDDSSILPDGEEDCITMDELRLALVNAGKYIDVIAFDLCLMAMPEVAYQVYGYTDYVVFSEETVPGYGFPYEAICQRIVDTPSMEPTDMCEMIVEEYALYYTGMGGYMTWTMSAFDMQYMDELMDAVDLLGNELLASLREYMQYYQIDVYNSQRYYYPYNVDLKGFALNLLDDKLIDDDGIDAAAEAVIAAVEAGVFANMHGPNSPDSYGIAIYIPSTNEGMHHIKDEYYGIPFAMETSWYDFVDTFSNFFGRIWGVGAKTK